MNHGIKYYWKACVQGLLRNFITVSWKWHCKSWHFPCSHSPPLTEIEHLQFLPATSVIIRKITFFPFTHFIFCPPIKSTTKLISGTTISMFEFALNTWKGKLEATHGIKDEVLIPRSMSSKSAPDTVARAPPPWSQRRDWAGTAQGELEESVKEIARSHISIDTWS